MKNMRCAGLINIFIAATIIYILSPIHVNAASLPLTRYVSTTGNDIGNCIASTSPCRSIQYAINQSISGDTILVSQGMYTYNQSNDPCPFLKNSSIGKDGSAVVCIVDKTLTIQGGYPAGYWQSADPTTFTTIIDGQNAHRGIFFIGFNSTTASLDLEGFIIQNSQVHGPDSETDPSGLGAGMMVAGANVSLKDIIFRANKVYGKNTSSGAGGTASGSALNINWSRPGTTNSLERVTFINNQSFGGSGPVRGGLAFGALFVNAKYDDVIIRIKDCSFTNNQAFAGNSSGSGSSGGLNADALGGAIGGGSGLWEIDNIFASGNQVIGGNASINGGGGFGGAIHIELAKSFIMSDSTISDNLAKGGVAINGGFGAGGGILINSSPSSLNNVKIIANSAIGGNGNVEKAGAGGGGGLYLWMTRSGPKSAMSITNSIIADNFVGMGTIGDSSAGGGGGGIQIQGVDANINHTTISNNRLDSKLVSGNAVLILSDVTAGSASVNINYSIIANHTAGGPGVSAVLVQINNTVSFNRGLFAGNIKDTNNDGSPMPDGNFIGLTTMLGSSAPKFISPGSPNYNFHLRLDSLAKDNAIGSSINVDFDGQNRHYNNISDLGADEYWPFPLSATPGDGSIFLNWFTDATYLDGGVTRYDVIITCPTGASPPDQGNCGQPINAGLGTTFQLTGLTNFRSYSFIIRAKDSLNTTIAESTSLQIFPTDLQIFLPSLVK
ncbi:MAG: hypothetical protein ACYDH1_07860 [Anaerolineaceae bacterium]